MFKIFRLAAVCGLMLAASQSARATVVTFDFTGITASGVTSELYYGSVGGVTGTAYSLGAYVGNTMSGPIPTLTASSLGLGVDSGTAEIGSASTVDGRGSDHENVVFLMSEALTLTSLTFKNADSSDSAWVMSMTGASTFFVFSSYTIQPDGSLTVSLDDTSVSTMFGVQALTGSWTISAATFETDDPTVPEPATLGLVGLGVAGIGALRRRSHAA